MKIAILGGTGDLGKGLALRLAKKNEVVIGSREKEKAEKIAEEYKKEAEKYGFNFKFTGLTNQEAVESSDKIIISVPHEVLPQFLITLKNYEGKLFISPIVPMTKTKFGFSYEPFRIGDKEVSAAELIRSTLQGARVASAFHTVPAMRLSDLNAKLNYDVLIAAEDRATFADAAEIVSSIEGLNPFYAGKLYVSKYLESLTPLLLNIALNNGLHAPSLKIV
ncbi:MAG: NADPH-dependent F420 reductase [Nitrososphaeria archaeon]|jgi:NADPH-dependent F420 reductase